MRASIFMPRPSAELKLLMDFNAVSKNVGINFANRTSRTKVMKEIVKSHCSKPFPPAWFINGTIREWANPVLERIRDGIFPYEWRSHSYGKRKFPMNHEWHIPIFPMKGLAGVVKNNFPMLKFYPLLRWNFN